MVPSPGVLTPLPVFASFAVRRQLQLRPEHAQPLLCHQRNPVSAASLGLRLKRKCDFTIPSRRLPS